MNFRDIDENMDVKLKEDYSSNNTFIKKGSKGKVKSLLVFGFVSVRFGEIEVVCNPNRLEKYEGGTTMTEKEASDYCADSQLEKQVKELKDEFHEYRRVVNHAVNKLKERVDELESQGEQAPEELPQLTPLEKHILELVSEEYEWVAKDPEDNAVCVYEQKPTYNEEWEQWEREVDEDYKIISQFDVVEFENLPTNRPYRISELIKEG